MQGVVPASLVLELASPSSGIGATDFADMLAEAYLDWRYFPTAPAAKKAGTAFAAGLNFTGGQPGCGAGSLGKVCDGGTGVWVDGSCRPLPAKVALAGNLIDDLVDTNMETGSIILNTGSSVGFQKSPAGAVTGARIAWGGGSVHDIHVDFSKRATQLKASTSDGRSLVVSNPNGGTARVTYSHPLVGDVSITVVLNSSVKGAPLVTPQDFWDDTCDFARLYNKVKLACTGYNFAFDRNIPQRIVARTCVSLVVSNPNPVAAAAVVAGCTGVATLMAGARLACGDLPSGVPWPLMSKLCGESTWALLWQPALLPTLQTPFVHGGVAVLLLLNFEQARCYFEHGCGVVGCRLPERVPGLHRRSSMLWADCLGQELP
jgi:hypothetical protein